MLFWIDHNYFIIIKHSALVYFYISFSSKITYVTNKILKNTFIWVMNNNVLKIKEQFK